MSAQKETSTPERPLRMFVTGANGFIGSAVVEAALDAGHEVTALIRMTTDADTLPWATDDRVTLVRGDIRIASTYAAALDNIDVVAHLAAVFGDFFDQFNVTVVGTERLLGAMSDHKVGRMVLVSTFSNYDYRALPTKSTISESSPLEANPNQRDGYTQTKLYQEQVTKAWCDQNDIALTVIRPGAVYGVGKLWNGGLAKAIGQIGVAVAPRSTMKLTYVHNCADAIVLAATRDEAIGETLNIVDDDLPTHNEYLAAMRRHGFEVPSKVVPVPYAAMLAVTSGIDVVNTRFFGGKAKLPELFVPAKLAAAYRPHRYSNDQAKRVLGWTPRKSLDQALEEIAVAERSGR